MCSASQPSLRPSQLARRKRHALLPEQRVAAIARSDRPDRILLRKMDDEAAVGTEVAEGVQAAREVVRIARWSSATLPDARHDAHVQDDVLAVGDLDADFGEPRSRRAHQERNHVHRPALHGALEERGQLRARLVRRHPVVVGAGVFLRVRADERQMFGARDVVRRAAVQVASRHLLLIELDQLPRGEALGEEAILLCLRSVAENHRVWTRKVGDLVDPLLDGSRDTRPGRHMRADRTTNRAAGRAARPRAKSSAELW